MNFLASLFGTNKAVQSVIDNTAKGINSLVFTKQEKAQAQEKATEQAREFFIKYMESTSGQNIARRLIAIIVICCWAGCFALTVAFSIATPFVATERQQALTEATNSIFEALVNFGVLGIVAMIIGFYFYLPNGRESLDYMREFLPKRNQKGQFIK